MANLTVQGSMQKLSTFAIQGRIAHIAVNTCRWRSPKLIYNA